MDAAEYALMDEAEDTMWWYRALHRRLVHALRDVSGAVLDAGCGTGGLLKRLRVARPDLSLYAIDFFPEAVSRAAAKSGAATAQASVMALPFPDASFDAVVSADVLCHRSLDPQAAVMEIRRVLRPGGLLVLNMPGLEWLRSAHDMRVHTARRVSARQMKALLQDAGYTAVTARYWNSLLLPLMALQRKLLAKTPDAESDVKVYHPWLDAALFTVTRVERMLPFSLPAGGSVIATGRAP